MPRAFIIGDYSFRPTQSTDGRVHWTIYRKGERTWSTASIHMASDKRTHTVSMHMHETDARPDLASAVELLCGWLDIPAPAPRPNAYLDRFPPEARAFCDRAYQDGFEDGANA